MNTHRKDMPTQIAHPWKATVRTAVTTIVSAAVLFVVAQPIIEEQLGAYLPDAWAAWYAAAAGFLTALGAALTRIMALEQAQRVLALVGLGTGIERETDSASPDA
ncbi:hypothetical protein ACTXMZ_02260 [Brachybacterium alimentarium]|uniref:hypothetical protein n=1 Tax=Brachybacterium alimentarium TaxID=47845 RepID=UPI003FCFE921